MIELIIVMLILVVLATLAVTNLRVTKEKLACKNIYSAFQTAKMRAVSTGYTAYVDFDMDEGAGGKVSDNFYTLYLDTDGDSLFGELNNGTYNEFNEAGFPMPDTSGGFPGVLLPDGVKFGFAATNAPANDRQGNPINNGSGTDLEDGVDFGGSNRVSFLPTGMAGASGVIYLYDSTVNTGVSCSVELSTLGSIKRSDWDGSGWN